MDDFLADREPALELRHQGCEAPVQVHLQCSAGHDVEAHDVVAHPDPGLVRRPWPAGRS